MLLTIVVFILILGLLIFVHEFGHFIVAKRKGLKVLEFGFGFPPRLFGIKRGETTYSINLIPIGGFVKILGEEGGAESDPRSFASQPIRTRALILAAGVLMNFLLAMVLLGIGFKIGLPQVIDSTDGKVRDEKIQIVYVSKDSPAEKSGLTLGDQIVSINGDKLDTVETMQNKIKEKAGDEIKLEVKRGDKFLEIKITPRENPPEKEGALGVGLVKTGIVSYPLWQAIWKGIIVTISMIGTIFVAFYEIIKNLIVSKPVTAELAGPVGIAVITGQVTKMGFVYVLQFAAVLSINLGIINILPFPALDGGRILFLVIEKIRGKKVSQKVENLIHTIGFALLILLMIFVTFRDIFRFRDVFTRIWEKITNWF
jgi:regulator of sigma E protease